MSQVLILRYVTLDDVRAEVAAKAMNEPAFVDAVLHALQAAPGDADQDFIRCLASPADVVAQVLSPSDEDMPADPEVDMWLDLQVRLYRDCILTHPRAGELRRTLQNQLSRGQTLLVSHRRTLRLVVESRKWDGRTMPDDSLGAETSVEALAAVIRPGLLDTVGGEQFVALNPVRGPLVVLAHTLAVLLGHDDAQRRKPHVSWPLVRADVYEDAVQALGLMDHFKTVRQLLEMDHPKYLASLGLGILEYRGRDHHLVLRVPREQVHVLKKRN